MNLNYQHSRSQFLLLLLFSFLASSKAFAQAVLNDTLKIKEVEVSSDSKYLNDNAKFGDTTLLKSKTLQLNDGISFSPVLNTIPGVYMQQAALNTNRIVVRGVGSRTQYSSNRIKAYINNIPISGADGETVFEDLDPNLFESLTLYKSPQVKYGSNLGGTFVFETSPNFKNQISHSQTIGSFGLLSNSTVASISNKNSSFALAYNKVEKDGYRDNSNYRKDGFTLLGEQRFGEKSTINYYFQYTDLKAYIPSSISEVAFNDSPKDAAFIWGQSQGFEAYKKFITGLNFELKFGKNISTSTTLFAQFKDGYEPRPFNILDEDYERLGVRFELDWTHNLAQKPSILNIGIEYIDDFADIKTFENLYQDFIGQGSIEGNQINQNLQFINSTNYFLSETTNWSEKLKSTIGLNYTTNTYRTEQIILVNEEERTLDPILSPLLKIDYQLNPKIQFYGIWAYGSSNPGVENALNSDGTFNDNINSEKGRNLEIGSAFHTLQNQIRLNLAIYNLQLTDLIISQPVAEDEFIIANAGNATNSGIEFSAFSDFPLSDDWKLSNQLNASFNFYNFENYSSNSQALENNNLAGSPSQTISLLTSFHLKNKLYLNLQYLNVGEIPLNDENTNYSDAYSLLNFTADYKMQLHKNVKLELKAGINNIFDKNYAASILPNAVGFGTNLARFYYPGDARNYFGRIKLAWIIK